MKITMMDVSKINVAGFNPALRTTPKALLHLRNQIEVSGEIYPLEIGCDGILGDGHRRLAVAKELCIEKLPTIKSKTRTAAQIYYGQNNGQITKSTKSAEWFQAVRQGYPIEMVPDAAKVYIKYLYRILDESQIDDMTSAGRSPGIVQIVRRVASHVGATDDAELQKICMWIYTNGIQRPTRIALDNGCPPDVVLQAIAENRPIKNNYA